MTAARRIGEAERYVRGRKWRIGWSPTLLLGGAIYGKTLGILGLGRIGAAVAERAKGFNMRVIYHDAERSSPERERALGVQFVELEELLRTADFVSLHTPLTPETRNLINEDRLRMMKDTSVLINTSRGPIVDEKALAKALRQSWIAAAGLDVYEKEPISPKSPLLRLQNVVLAPHIASATRESRSKMSEIAAANLLALLRGERPPHLVNPEVQQVRPLSEIRML
jgi:glyoxylate reductase